MRVPSPATPSTSEQPTHIGVAERDAFPVAIAVLGKANVKQWEARGVIRKGQSPQRSANSCWIVTRVTATEAGAL